MAVLSSLVLAESDPLTREAVRFAFEREGIAVGLADSADAAATLLSHEARQLVIVGAGVSEAAGVDVLESLRAGWRQGNGAVPLLFLGEPATHARALAAGATQCMPRPGYARDVVTVARLLANRKTSGGPPTFIGELGDFSGVYYVARALAAARWRGVLTLVRGLRRGELRLYEGEVTSAQVGVLHGLAALHQLLLWTEARVELRVEDVVRRRQIPLDPDETLADCERFLTAIREVSGPLSPAQVFEQQVAKIKELPREVLAVARLFDGARTVADVIEDSPYRAFETLRVAARLLELDMIRAVQRTGRTASRAALAIEEWLVGRSPVPQPQPRQDSEPTAVAPGAPGAWTSVLPSAMQPDLPGYAAVVPSVSTGGEISVQRERLEDVMDAAERSKLFGGGAAAQTVATDVAPEPAPVVKEIQTEPTVKLPRGTVAADTGQETRAALAALPSPTERLHKEADEAVHAAHDAAAAAELAMQAMRAVPFPEPEPEPPPPEPDDAATGVVERVDIASDMLQAPAKVLEPIAVTSGEMEARAPSEPPAAPDVEAPSIVVEDQASGLRPQASGESAAAAAPAAAPAPFDSAPRFAERSAQGERVDHAPVVAPVPVPVPTPAPAWAPRRHPRAATPAPQLDADAAKMVAQAQRAAEAIAAFSQQEEEFFRAGAKLHEQPHAPVESFDDLETGPPKTFWQRLVARPDAVPRADSEPVARNPPPRKK